MGINTYMPIWLPILVASLTPCWADLNERESPPLSEEKSGDGVVIDLWSSLGNILNQRLDAYEIASIKKSINAFTAQMESWFGTMEIRFDAIEEKVNTKIRHLLSNGFKGMKSCKTIKCAVCAVQSYDITSIQRLKSKAASDPSGSVFMTWNEGHRWGRISVSEEFLKFHSFQNEVPENVSFCLPLENVMKMVPKGDPLMTFFEGAAVNGTFIGDVYVEVKASGQIETLFTNLVMNMGREEDHFKRKALYTGWMYSEGIPVLRSLVNEANQTRATKWTKGDVAGEISYYTIYSHEYKSPFRFLILGKERRLQRENSAYFPIGKIIEGLDVWERTMLMVSEGKKPFIRDCGILIKG